MKYINPLPPTKVLGPQLDVRHQSNRTLSGLMGQLQTGSTIKATISEVTQDGDVIFTTNHGEFSMPNELNLYKGDKIIAKLSVVGDVLFGTITSINDAENTSTEPIQLSFTKTHTRTFSAEAASTQLNINTGAIPAIQQALKTKITYINLSNINKNSLIYKMVGNIDIGSSIEFKVIQDSGTQALSPYQITGEVIENNDSAKLIKTPFGIVSTDNKELPIGKKLILEIKTINDVNVGSMTAKSNIEDFLFNFNKNWPLLQHILDTLKIPKNKSNKGDINHPSRTNPTPGHNNPLLSSFILSDDSKTDIRERIFRFFISSTNKEAFKELSDNFIKLKELFASDIKPQDYNAWQAFFLPVWDGEKIVNNKVFIKRKPSEFIRFIIEISLEMFQKIQIDGLVTLGTNKIPISFDLIVRFKGVLDRKIQSKISEIFLLNQNLSAVRGTLNFEQVEEFIIKPELETM